MEHKRSCETEKEKKRKKEGKIAKYDSQLDFKCKSKPKLESNAKVT